MDSLLRKKLNRNNIDGAILLHEINSENSDLKYVSFKLIDLQIGITYREELNWQECCIVVMTGKITFTDGEVTHESIGTRNAVFEKKPTDSVYVSNNRIFKVKAETNARIALCYSPSSKQLPTKLIKGADIKPEHRGKGNNQRLVHNILPDDNPSANSLLVVEVFTEGGNWSSYPPHKHDKDNLPEESMLEETYYHEQDPKQGFVFQRVYTDDRSLDETMTVENGDMVIVPKGYHPVGVPAGYTSYYLNVMAGPKRVWKFNNDPDHEWIINS
ncbi:5-deoxy-glucuronate isomerase [Salipaludibacillus neizhouensis]|uniref:5-deoxy-glucuronate isomerase n=1 Tax=Salipaludibacillus neizhouensis TaxID=885475 RepID=A0A3A9K1S1_9BACI|nr:5-deoxy-glucuronate isomerase [Salipaludibacillus neizhouensis]RKL67054.1 5-deoxy-glucuronate isomerase [Salipaludibacillus neizhouensis]